MTATSEPTIIDRFHKRVFDAVYARALLYNACWEDPVLDRVAMDLDGDDTVLAITSAGCNVLDYALAGAGRVHAVDANPRQTALLELKIAAIRTLEYQDFFAIFGTGAHRDFAALYVARLRPQLSPFARRWFDARGHWFAGSGWRDSFYYCGLSGLVARLMRTYIDADRGLRAGLTAMLEVDNLEDQRALFDREVEPRLFGAVMRWAISRRSTMSLLGVPFPQARAVEASHADGIAGFIRQAVREVFRDLPLWTNHFWTVYLRGSYTPTNCPDYLRQAGFLALKGGLVERIVPHTCTLTTFLQRNEVAITHATLLDHMDWMSSYYPQALAEEWQALFSRLAPGARVIFRSASPDASFLRHIHVPERDGWTRVTDRLRFDHELAAALHRRDRVRTYASFHIADVAA
jgi:S-adenosylmethionine-diacylglycerol 3-amino-3-carboxypropyl transferase